MNKTSIGGQAIIEGVMMRGPNHVSIAVRKENKEIEVKNEALKLSKNALIKKPIIRGVYGLFSSMVIGIKALNYSAQFFDEGADYEKGKFEKYLESKFGDKADNIIIGFTMAFSLVMALLLFGAIPTVLTNFFKARIENQIFLSAIEGVIKISMFLAYILLISQMKDVKRVFQYHGAEHKSIHCLENGQELTVENAKKFTTLHPRCGTSFLIIVMIISILLFSLISWSSLLMRIIYKLALLPVVAGVSYEVIKFAGKSDSKVMKWVSYPGLMMQKLTTKEPDDQQLEVAITALKGVMAQEDQSNE